MTTDGLTFDSCVENGVASVYARRGAFLFGANLEEKSSLFRLFEDFEHNAEVHAVLLFNEPDAFDEHEHQSYVDALNALYIDGKHSAAQQLVEREDNGIDQMIMMLARYKKLVVSCLRGTISTPFVGISLATDFRLAADEMAFKFSHADLGVPPIGGLGYLLPKFVSASRTAQLLLRGGVVDAQSALRWELVNAVLTPEKFDIDCTTWVQKALASGTTHVAPTRELIHHDLDILESYLLKEAKVRRRALHRA